MFSDSYERAKEKLLLAENMSDLTADEGTENEIQRCDKEKRSRHMRAKKHSSSEECGFDSDTSKKGSKLLPFPKIPDKLRIINNKRLSENLKIIPPSSSNVDRSKSKCQMNPATCTKSSYKEATISKYTERKYDNSSDENGNSQNLLTEKHKNKITQDKNLITADNGL